MLLYISNNNNKKDSSRLLTNQTMSATCATESKSNIANTRINNHTSKTNQRITIMVIAVSFLFLTGNLLTSINRACILYFGPKLKYKALLTIISNTVLYLSHSCDLFIYLYFDKQFKSSLRRLATKLMKR